MSTVLKGFKIRAYPNVTQRALIARTLGAKRWLWNVALDLRSAAYNVSRMLTQWKKTPTLYPDPTVQRTSLWFAGITITALLTIATILPFAFAAVGTVACIAALGVFYFLKQRFMKAFQTR